MRPTSQASGSIFVCYFIVTSLLFLRSKIEQLTDNYRTTIEELTEEYGFSLLSGRLLVLFCVMQRYNFLSNYPNRDNPF
jgi:hypothetical protein